MPFAPLSEDLAERLRAEFPNYLSPGNPLDAWAVGDESVVYPRSLALLGESGAYDILLAQADLSQFRDEANEGWCELTLRALARVAEENDLFGAAVTVHSADPPRRFQELARELDLPLLRGARDATRALAGVTRRRQWRPFPGDGTGPRVGDLLSAGELSEHESALVLERYGVPFAPRRRAATPDDAARAVGELQPPVVVKLDGPAHKSRAGGVVLGVETPEAAAEAARRLGGGVLVAKQLPAAPEAICGMTRDPDFGPVLAIGSGGTRVEDLRRISVSIAPLELEGTPGCPIRATCSPLRSSHSRDSR
jgi:acetyltransferase